MIGTKGKLQEDRDAQSISLIRISCPRFAVAAFSTSIGKDRKGDEGSIRTLRRKNLSIPSSLSVTSTFGFGYGREVAVIVDPVTDARKSEKIDTWVNRIV